MARCAAAGKREECCRICGPYGSGKPSIPQITARTLRGTTDIAGLQKIYQIYAISLQKENKSQTSENKHAVL